MGLLVQMQKNVKFFYLLNLEQSSLTVMIMLFERQHSSGSVSGVITFMKADAQL